MNRSYHSVFSSIATLLVVAILVVGSQISFALSKSTSGFHLYYGNNPAELEKLSSQFKEGSIVVIDTRVFQHKRQVLDSFLATAKAKKTRVLGYLSIGEIHSDEVNHFRGFLEGFALGSGTEMLTFESMTIDKNEVFNSYRVDVLAKAWHYWIQDRAKELLKNDIDGLFLDTVDTIDRYASNGSWTNLERRGESVTAMIKLIRSLKASHSDRYFLQNGGLNMIGKTVFVGDEDGIAIPAMVLQEQHPHNPDGLLWENAFSGSGEWTKERLKILETVRKAGFTEVFTLGYRASFPNSKSFFEKSAAYDFLAAWAVSSAVLHKGATLAP